MSGLLALNMSGPSEEREMVVTEVQGGPAVAPQPAPAAAVPAPEGGSKFKAAAPVAAGALAIVAAVAGGSMFVGKGANEPAEMPAVVTEAPASPATPASAPAAAPQPGASTATALPDPAANPPPAAPPPEAAKAPPVVAKPKPGTAIPGLAFDQPAPAGVAQSVEIVDAFWKDKASAAAKFDALKARRPEFANLKLDRVTYSNELVLVHDGKGPVIQLGAMRELAAKLGKAADISYAEPNLTAHPGKQ
jgi:hypothetical protein